MAEVAAPKFPAVGNAKVDGIDVKGTTAVTYAAVFVGGISKTVTDAAWIQVLCSNVFVRVGKNPGEIFKITSDDFNVLCVKQLFRLINQLIILQLFLLFTMMKRLNEMLPLLRLW